MWERFWTPTDVGRRATGQPGGPPMRANSSNCSFTGTLRVAWAVATVALLGGCPPPTTPNGDNPNPVFNNTTDRTNNGATYIGSDACMACHPDVAAKHIVHGHGHKLTKIQTGAPVFPTQGERAGVPNPPEGKQWSDVAYVIGGYIRKGRFVDQNGYIMTDGVDGVNTQWNLDFPANGAVAGWTSYHADQVDPKPYDYSCFVCHTTGPLESDPANPTFQDNRPGMSGTFAEPGVQCEACHGPGSNHIPNPAARDNYVDVNATACKECHNRPFASDDGVIRASGGYVRHHEQWPELQASGGHASFSCTACHNPHVSTNYDRDNAIRNDCTVCHPDRNMALHSGKVFARGDYVEQLHCVSCHMPFATKSAGTAAGDVLAEEGRQGDTRTHIFRINASSANYTAMFNDDLSEVVKDGQGRAAVTVDFVCLRCHSGKGSAFRFTLDNAAGAAAQLHSLAP